jgi:molybdopterin-guanine dinucleotide biosynthesis protein
VEILIINDIKTVISYVIIEGYKENSFAATFILEQLRVGSREDCCEYDNKPLGSV